MSQWAEIRHMHLVDGVPKKEIARRMGLNVKTVRRAVACTVAPVERRSPARGRRLDSCREEIIDLLRHEPKLTAKRIGRVLGAKAAGVQERALRRYVRVLRLELKGIEAFVHRTHLPGATLEGDFFEHWVRIAGSLHKAKVFVATLPASNSYFAKAYPLERLECLLDGLNASFEYFGGLPGRGVLDNTSLAVKRILRGIEREETRDFHGWRGCFPLEVEFCAPAKGNEKGSVERGNEYVRGIFFRPIAEASSWEELNSRLLAELDRDLDHRKLPDGRTAREALIAEREHLRPLPPILPASCRIVPCVADKYALVTIDRSRYSVPSELTRRALLAKLYWDRVEIVDGERSVAVHRRATAVGTHVLDVRHVLRLLERKHRAIPEATAVQQLKLAPAFFELRDALRAKVRKSDREWIRVLLLLEECSIDALECAVLEALRLGSPNLETIRMLLRQRSSDAVVIAPVQVSDARIAAIDVAAPDLVGYDLLVGGAA